MGLWRDERKTERGSGRSTTQTKPSVKLSLNEGERTITGTLLGSEQRTVDTKSTTETPGTLTVEPVQTPATSESPSPSTGLVVSPSMSLIDESAAHIFGLMRGLHADLPAADVRAYDPDRVQAACQCADQIHKLMRLKLDVIRYAKEDE